MRILHIISQTPDFTGSGKFIQEMIRHSQDAGHENFLLAGVQADFAMPLDLVDSDHCLFVTFDGRDLAYPIPGMSDVMPYPSRVFSTLCDADMRMYEQAFKVKIQQAVALFQPQILHTHHLWVVSALARRLAPDIPMVTTCHGTCLRQHHLCPGVGKKIVSDLVKIDQVIALSRDQQQQIIDTIGMARSRVRVISGGYNKHLFFHTPKPCTGTIELLYAGKLSFAKGVLWLLNALAHIRDLPVRLHLAGGGSGPEKDACLAAAAKFGEQVVYHGPLSHQQLARLMQQAHVFVLPSFFEGLPLVLMEALACGCRIVTTALPGAKEVLGADQNAMVYFIDLPRLKTIDTPFEADLLMLENRLARILRDVAEAVAQCPEPDLACVQRLTRPYAWEKIYQRVESVYTDLT